ncbi:MAG: VTT domain-containing protein [Acidobacteriota bacterium]|nr:VTT domain-containing protein [Acidobacteriota bacterium]
MTSRTRLTLVSLGALALVVLVACILNLDVFLDTIRSWADTNGRIGMVGFGAAYVFLALLFVPGAALTVVAGAVYGIGWGLVVVGIATSVADAAAFLLGRYVARGAVLGLMKRYPRFQLVDRVMRQGGWRIVALVRLNPALPYGASNYLFGVTSVPFVTFLAASAVFTLPGAAAYLYLGYVGVETLGGSTRQPVEWLLLVLGLVVTLVAIGYVATLAKQALDNLDRTPPRR